MNTLTKGSLGEERVDFSLQGESPGKPRQELKDAGTEAETIKVHCLLTCSLYIAQPAFLRLRAT